MISRLGLLLVVGCAVTFSGCVGPARVNTVPWWKGLPCMVIAPSSIEAHVWREHLHRRDGQESYFAGETCACESFVDEPLEGLDPTGDLEPPPPQPEMESLPVESEG